MKFSNLKIAQRLLIGFGVILAMLVLCVGVAISQLGSLNDNVNGIVNNRIPKLNVANAWIVQLLETARHTRNMLILSDRDKIQSEIDSVYEEKKLRKEYLKQLQKVTHLPEGKKLLQAVIDARSRYTPIEDEYLKLVSAGDMVNAKDVLLNKARPEQLRYVQAIEKLVEFEAGIVKQNGITAESDYAIGRNVLIALGSCAALVSALMALFITKGLLKQLGGEPVEATKIALQISEGDLTAHVHVADSDQSSMMFAIKRMRDNLVQIVTDVRNGTDTIALASNEISVGKKEIKSLISDSVEKVDAGSKLVNQAGSTMEEIVGSVKRVNDIINEITEASNEQASGIDQINQAISQMDEVTQQNAALVEEAAAAAGSMQEQASHLVEVVRVFKTEEQVQTRTAEQKFAATASRKANQVVKITSASRTPARSLTSKTSSPRVAMAGGGGWEQF